MSNIFETALEKIGRIISRQHGIEVICEGNQACTDGQRIILPAMKDVSPEIKKEFHGFLDHEAAHIKFTEFGEMKKCRNEFHRNLLNAVEDERIERLMGDEFPGAVENLKVINDKYGTLLREKRGKGELSPAHRIILSVRDIMAGDEYPFEEDIEELMEALRPLAEELNEATTTTELRRTTESITKFIDDHEEEKRKEEEKKKAESKKEKGDDLEIDDGGGEPEEDDESSEGGSEKSDEGESEGEGESESDGEDSDEESETKKSDKGGHPDYEGDRKPATDEMSSHLKDDPVPDFEAMFNEEIAPHILKDGRKAGYLPITTRFDKEHDYSGKGNAKVYGDLKKKVMPYVGGIRRELERILKVQENARWKTEQDRGDLSQRDLSKMAADKSYRKVFRKFKRTETNNVAVQILVDESGSMGGGGKIVTAQMAVIAMAEALNTLQIPFEVTGFNSIDSRQIAEYTAKLERENPGSTKRFFRKREILEYGIYKSFDTNQLTGISELRSRYENPDGEAVRWAAKRLSMRKEKRKILIVLSDGMPACGSAYGRPDGFAVLNKDLEDTVKALPKNGIEVVGFGILTDAPKRFYPNHVVIKDLKDLPKATMKRLSKLITNGGL